MPRKARDIFKARGYTDQELDTLPLLQDVRFCAAIEAEDVEREGLVSRNTTLQKNVDDTVLWYNSHAKPTLERALQDAVKSDAERARLQAQIEAEQRYGMRRVANQDDQQNQNQDQNQNRDQNQNQNQNRDQQNRNANTNANANTDPDPRYVTSDMFNTAFQQTGTAISMATDILEDHRDLFGKRLPGGIGALREKYASATQTGFRGTLRDYWEREFQVETKRNEITAKERQDHDQRVADEAVAKFRSEQGNPMTRTYAGSRSPFIKAPLAGAAAGADGAYPWNNNPQQRSNARVTKFVNKSLNTKAS